MYQVLRNVKTGERRSKPPRRRHSIRERGCLTHQRTPRVLGRFAPSAVTENMLIDLVQKELCGQGQGSARPPVKQVSSRMTARDAAGLYAIPDVLNSLVQT